MYNTLYIYIYLYLCLCFYFVSIRRIILYLINYSISEDAMRLLPRRPPPPTTTPATIATGTTTTSNGAYGTSTSGPRCTCALTLQCTPTHTWAHTSARGTHAVGPTRWYVGEEIYVRLSRRHPRACAHMWRVC